MIQHIIIEQLKVEALIGVYDNERLQTQPLWLDIKLTLANDSIAGATDQLSDTVDYATVCQIIRTHITQTNFQLLEALAQYLALLLLNRFPSITRCRLTVHKKPFDLLDVQRVGVQVSLTQTLPQPQNLEKNQDLAIHLKKKDIVY